MAKEEVLEQIREYRSNEMNFEKIYGLLEKELDRSDGAYRESLEEVKEKEVEVYRKSRESGGTAWPEFEKFVSAFERAMASGEN